MTPSAALATDLWREIVARLDEGVIVLNEQGIAIYSNAEAARLLDYSSRVVLDLDKSDLVALCDLDRLDGLRFARALLLEAPPEGALDRPYEIVTASRHLRVKPIRIVLEHGAVTILSLREISAWRSDLIADTVTAQLQGPLSAIEHYSRVLFRRLQDGSAHPYELNDLVRIILESLERATIMWDVFANLRSSDPRHQTTPPVMESVDLAATFRGAAGALQRDLKLQTLNVRFNIPADLPAAQGSAAALHLACYILLEQMLMHIHGEHYLAVLAHNRERYIQIELHPDLPDNGLRSHAFDTLPLAVAEQIVMQYGGRIWIEGERRKPGIVNLSIPIWKEQNPQPKA